MFKIETAAIQNRSLLKDIFVVLGGSLLISLFAHVSIKLPFTPIPISLQPHVCLFLGAFLGSRRGSLAVLAFLLQGGMGLPVFATGTAGLLVLLGPKGGYLLGYVVAAFVTGYLIENGKTKTPRLTVLSMVAGNLIIYTFGLLHLSNYLGWKGAIIFGMLPFLIGDMIKLALSYQALKTFGPCIK